MAQPLGTVPAAIGALSSNPGLAVPSPLTSLLQAVGQYKQLTEDQQVKDATNEDQLRTFAQKQLQDLASRGIDNPKIGTDPRVRAQVAAIYRTLGAPPPVNSDGTYNFSQMAATPFGDLNLDDRTKLAAEVPSVRQALGVSGAPSGFMTNPASAATTAAAQNKAYMEIDGMTKQLASGGITPQQFATGMLKNRGILDADTYAAYTSPEFLQNYMSQYGEAQLYKLQQEGFQIPNNEQYRNKLLQFNMDKFNATFGETKKKDQAQIDHWQMQDQANLQKADAATSRANTAAQALQANLPLISAKTTSAQWGVIEGRLRSSTSAYNGALREYVALQTSIQNGINNNHVPDPRLIDTYNALGKTVTDLYNQMQNQRSSLQSMPTQEQAKLGSVMSNVAPMYIDPAVLTTLPGVEYSKSLNLYRYNGHTYSPQGQLVGAP